jgi:hypothetical protein
MRIVGITFLSLALGAGAVLAQAGAAPPAVSPPVAPKAAAPASPKSPVATPAPATAKSRAKENVAECMRLWDAATHMTKQQWAQTCERIQIRLENLRIENMDFMGTSLRKKKG